MITMSIETWAAFLKAITSSLFKGTQQMYPFYQFIIFFSFSFIFMLAFGVAILFIYLAFMLAEQVCLLFIARWKSPGNLCCATTRQKCAKGKDFTLSTVQSMAQGSHILLCAMPLLALFSHTALSWTALVKNGFLATQRMISPEPN